MSEYKISYEKRKSLRVMSFMAIVFSIIVIAFVAGSVIVKAGNSYNDSDYHKCFKDITVSEGDTLWSIADEYMDENHYESIYSYMNEISDLNHLSSDDLKTGQILLISYYILNEE